MKRALIVGIDAYLGASLQGCVSDAVALGELLGRDEDGSPNFTVKLVTAPEATIQQRTLKRQLIALFEEPCDAALFYFAGYGPITGTGGYLVTPDYQDGDEGISMDEVLKLANRSPVRNKIVILDCCHSGAFGNAFGDDGGHTEIAPGVTILTSCRESERADEHGRSAVFTSLVLEALEGGAADLQGDVTPASVYTYVDRCLGPWEQRPIFKINVTQFCSLRRTTPPIDPAVLRLIGTYFKGPDTPLPLDPDFEPDSTTPDPAKTSIFGNLQKMVRVGLVRPVGQEHMYYAAMHSRRPAH